VTSTEPNKPTAARPAVTSAETSQPTAARPAVTSTEKASPAAGSAARRAEIKASPAGPPIDGDLRDLAASDGRTCAPAGGFRAGGLRIAFQGEQGAFSDEAVLACFGDRTHRVPCRTFEDVACALRDGMADLAMLPVENSTIGLIHGSLDVIDRYQLISIAEHTLPVRLCLLGVHGTRLEDIRIIRSHPAALAQCSRFLRTHPHARTEPVHDTAGAAHELADAPDPRAGAIASRSAAERYGLSVLMPDIHDAEDNRTRFEVFKRGA
jgi:hypothetical protein